MMTLKGKFIGHDKILKVEPAGKTYLGKPRVRLDFGGTFLELPKEVAEEVATKEYVEDLAILQNKRIQPVAQKMVVLLTEAELNRDDIQALIQTTLPNTIFEINKAGKEKLFGKKDHEVTLLDLDKILKDENNKRV